MMNSRHFGLIETKLNAFHAGADFVPRNAVIRTVFQTDSNANVITIIGAAGSGKSSLMGQINQSVTELGMRSCWLSLEKDDNNLAAFLSYFTATLSHLDPKIGERAFQMNGTKYLAEPSAIFQTLCEDISRFKKPCFIFMDDVQHLEDPTLLHGIDKFISALPQHIKLVLASRSQIQLSLSRKRIEGTLLEIDQTDLNLSLGEISELFDKHPSVSLNPEELRVLHTSTEGWAAGLQMAGLTMAQDPQNASQLLNGFSGSNQSINSYLMESVVKLQNDKIRKFLQLTAPLSRMNKDVCEAITGYDDAGAILEFIHQQNLFLIPLDMGGNWYRYHHLFADFLVKDLQKHESGRFENICAQASRWFQDQGYYTEAIQYLLSAGQYTESAKLIASQGVEVAQHLGDHLTILDWMRRLPQDNYDDHPLIRLNYAWSLMFTQSSELAREIAAKVKNDFYNHAHKKWEDIEEEADNILCLADVIIAISYASDDNTIIAQSKAESALAKWAKAPAFHRGALYNSLAYSFIANMDFDKGLDAATQARALGVQANANYVVVWADWISAIICLKKGLLREAERYLEHGRKSVARILGPQLFSNHLLSILQAEIHLDRGEMDAAISCMNSASGFSAIVSSMEPLFILQRTKARILMAQNRYEDAVGHLRSAQEHGLASEAPRISVFLAAEEIKLHIRERRVDEARAVARRWGFLEQESIFDISYDREITHELRRNIQLRLFMLDQHHGKALGIIPKLLASAKQKKRGRLVIELIVFKAINQWCLGQHAEAMRTLSTATTLASGEQFTAPFTDNAAVTGDILKSMIDRRGGTSGGHLTEAIRFERGLLDIIQNKDQSEPALTADANKEEDFLVEPMSPREIEILDLLALGMSNKELANALLVSVPTIKWHLNNIFDKLGVRNRTASVAKARKLKIIKS